MCVDRPGPMGHRGEEGPTGVTPTSELVERAIESVFAEQRKASPERLGGLEYALTALTPALSDLAARLDLAERERDDAETCRDQWIIMAGKRLEERDEARDAISGYMKQSSEQADEARKWRFRAESSLPEIMARLAKYERALREIAEMLPNAGSENQPVYIARRALETDDEEAT